MQSSKTDLSPELVARLRERRPGYDRIVDLVRRYEQLSQPDIKGITQDELVKGYVVPLFEALGWGVRYQHATRISEANLRLNYEGTFISVEVERHEIRGTTLQSKMVAIAERVNSRWAIITSFETVLILDVANGKTILETGPNQYISNPGSEHDILAAAIFYERVVKVQSVQRTEQPEPNMVAQSSAADGSGIQDLEDKVIINGVSVPKRQVPVADTSTSSDESSSFEYDAFLAFNHNDINFARRLDTDLTKQGLRIWFDDRELKPGDPIEETIMRGLESSSAFTVVVSPDSMKSDWVNRLIQQAFDLFKQNGTYPRIIPIMYRDAPLPIEISDFLWVDFRDPNLYEQSTTDLVRGIRGETLTEPAQAQSSTAQQPSEAQPAVSSKRVRTEIPTRALADVTSEKNDLLRFEEYAQALADFIKNEKTGKPLTIGIDAPWGMGKSTLMKMLRRKLSNAPPEKEDEESSDRKIVRGENGLPTVWFNAWKYSKEESLWAALALEILTQMNAQFSRRERIRFWIHLASERFDRELFLRRVLKSVGVVAIVGLVGAIVFALVFAWAGAALNLSFQDVMNKYIGAVGVVGLLAAIYSAGKEAYDKIAGSFDLDIGKYIREPKYQERIGFLAEFEQDFRCIVDVITKNGRWPLVVFIDDLDRCAPPKPTDIVEAINLLLDAKHCVFVIGMDARTVAGAIEAKYKDLKPFLDDIDDPGGLTLGQRFLEKIVQINFRIPKSDPQVFSSYIQRNLRVEKEETAKPSAPEVKRVAEKIQAEQRTGKTIDEAAQAVQAAEPALAQDVVVQAKQEAFAQSFDDSPDVQKAVEEAALYLGYNPRKIKQFINLFRLRALIANRRGLLETQTIDLGSLAKWVMIRTRWPDLIKAADANPKFIERFKQAVDFRTLSLDESIDPKKRQQAKTMHDMLIKDKHIERLIDAQDLLALLDSVMLTPDAQTYISFV